MRFTLLFFLCFGNMLFAQTPAELTQEILDYQAEENEKFVTKETTILTNNDFRKFKGLVFYPIDLKYQVTATFVRTPDEKPFLMPTSTSRKPEYVKYGEAHFMIDNEKYKLNLYKNTSTYDDPEFKDNLFLPFTDFTSGDGSYGGGRYIDARIPKGDKIIIDFNKAYNPYCAYSHNYSCPIPPKENDLTVRIEAGVRDFEKH